MSPFDKVMMGTVVGAASVYALVLVAGFVKQCRKKPVRRYVISTDEIIKSDRIRLGYANRGGQHWRAFKPKTQADYLISWDYCEWEEYEVGMVVYHNGYLWERTK